MRTGAHYRARPQAQYDHFTGGKSDGTAREEKLSRLPLFLGTDWSRLLEIQTWTTQLDT
jgi:hypothetical protein